MDDEQLAAAWESFATALYDVPRQREYRARMAYLMRGTSLADLGLNRQQQLAAKYQNMSLHAASHQRRGIRPGIFGLGITL